MKNNPIPEAYPHNVSTAQFRTRYTKGGKGPATITFIHGTVGSGKTTLANCLYYSLVGTPPHPVVAVVDDAHRRHDFFKALHRLQVNCHHVIIVTEASDGEFYDRVRARCHKDTQFNHFHLS